MRYTILGFLWAVALIAYIQRSAISVPLQEIGKDLCVVDADQALGFLVSAWYFGYAIFQLPAGRFADTIGGRRALVLLTVLWSLATAAAGFARTYWELVAVWTLMGALQAGVFPCAVRSIGQLFGEKERARASAWLGTGMLAGGAIAPVLTAKLLEWLGLWAATDGIQLWRICLVLYGLPGLVWAAAYWFQTTSAGLDARQTQRAEMAHGDAVHENNTSSPVPRVGPLAANSVAASPWLDRSLLLLCGQQFLRAAAMIFFITWFPTFLRETRGVSLAQSGLLTTYTGVAAMLGVIAGGYASDWVFARTGNKRIARQGLAVVGMATCSVLILLSSFVTNVNTAVAMMSLGAFVASFGGVAGYTVAIDYGGDRVGTVFGTMNMAGNFGAALFPVTVGWLVTATGTWNAALVLFAALMAIDAVLWSILNPRHQYLEPRA